MHLWTFGRINTFLHPATLLCFFLPESSCDLYFFSLLTLLEKKTFPRDIFSAHHIIYCFIFHQSELLWSSKPYSFTCSLYVKCISPVQFSFSPIYFVKHIYVLSVTTERDVCWIVLEVSIMFLYIPPSRQFLYTQEVQSHIVSKLFFSNHCYFQIRLLDICDRVFNTCKNLPGKNQG